MGLSASRQGKSTVAGETSEPPGGDSINCVESLSSPLQPISTIGRQEETGTDRNHCHSQRTGRLYLGNCSECTGNNIVFLPESMTTSVSGERGPSWRTLGPVKGSSPIRLNSCTYREAAPRRRQDRLYPTREYHHDLPS
jgi:hypothetical protein